MSDYLWDKTGEPDAEVERLEALLGTLAHQPRALELPATAHVARVEHAPPFLQRRAPRPAWAVAAALALMLLAGAYFFAARRADDGGLAAATSGGLHNLKEMLHEFPDTRPSPDKKMTPAGRPAHQHTARLAPPARRRRGAGRINAALAKKDRDAEARAEEPRRDLLAVVSERQQEAKAQLIYALRLTGAKLSEVQTKVRGAGEERPAGEGRDKIR